MTANLPFTLEQLESITAKQPTPFHLYDEAGIRATARELIAAFSWAPEFREHFAVKATPNPYILAILREEGCGTDCSSMAELHLSDAVGITGEQIMFTSNNTPYPEFQRARELGAVINLDDITHINYLDEHVGLPELLSFRYNPGPTREGNPIIGSPEEAKYGFTREQILKGYGIIQDRGVKRFGLHTMVISNELDSSAFAETARMLFELALEVHASCGVRIELINLGGGIGIPYQPDQDAVDIAALGAEIRSLYDEMIGPSPLHPLRLAMENGRIMTGPHGYLVTRAGHHKNTYRHYVGVDACMADLMRPGMYGAYHHITVMGKQDSPHDQVYDVVGSLCENNDKFAIQRELPEIESGDLLVIHDSGAHGHAMGFNYNGKLRSAELLLREDGSVQEIRRAETEADYFATLDYPGLK
jgi:diaminopimelate decarboxylase